MFNFIGKNKVFNNTVLHQVTTGQTLKDIAKQYNTNLEVLKQNPTKELYAGQCIALTNLDKKYHVVKPAETIQTIAQKYKTTPEIILQKNKVRQIFIGQLLEV